MDSRSERESTEKMLERLLFSFLEKKSLRNSAHRTYQETGQRVPRARRARTRPMWPDEQTGLGGGRIDTDDRTGTCDRERYSCSPFCAPSSISFDDSETIF